MEDQGKRLLLAVAIAFGLMMVWNFIFPPEQKEEKEEDESAEVEKAEGEKADGSEGTAEKKAEAEADKPKGEEVLITLENSDFRATFSSYGGVLKSWELLGERYVEKDGKTPINLVRTTAEEGYPFATPFIDSTVNIAPTAEWVGEKKSDDEVVFVWKSDKFRATKTFKVVPEDYILEVEVEFKNLGSEDIKQVMALDVTSKQSPSDDDGGGWGRMPMRWQAACYISGELQLKGAKSVRKSAGKWTGDISWAGFVHPYFMAAVAPGPDTNDERMRCLADSTSKDGGMQIRLIYPSLTQASNEPAAKWTAFAYYGPKYLDKLDTMDKIVGFKTDLRESVDLGFLGFLGRPLLWLLKKFQGFVGNWGLAIILLTLLVKGLLLPFTHKSMKSMKRMGKLSPKMKEIQAKYKDDKQVQQQKIMELYKSEGVNPLGGCLPMILQMPIWFALYRMLTMAAELYNAPFIPGWIDDLVSPDPYYVMPVLLTVTMFAQSKLTASAATGMQQKMLMYGMPLMFGAFSFVFPSGLTLYIFTNTVLTGVHHLYIHFGEKKLEQELAAKRPASKSKPDDSSKGGAKSEKKKEKVSDDGASEDADKPKASGSGGGNGGGGGKGKGKKRGGKGKGKKGKKRR